MSGAGAGAPGDLLPGFRATTFQNRDVRLSFRIGGEGPPLLLLHGYPESHAAWHRVAPELAAAHTLVMPDLRGYGESSCPPAESDHRAYAKRTMAADMLELMDSLGFGAFSVMGHDRGARVAYRLALDHAQAVQRLVVLDIKTTWDQFRSEQTASRGSQSNWTFMAQPAPLPETLIGANPVEWLDSRFRRGTRARSLEAIDPRALAFYRTSMSDPDRIHATCEDHRAGATCDLADDQCDLGAGRRIQCPVLLVWGSHGNLADGDDPVAAWRAWCRSVRGAMVESGHYIAEENPAALLAAVVPFLAAEED